MAGVSTAPKIAFPNHPSQRAIQPDGVRAAQSKLGSLGLPVAPTGKMDLPTLRQIGRVVADNYVVYCTLLDHAERERVPSRLEVHEAQALGGEKLEGLHTLLGRGPKAVDFLTEMLKAEHGLRELVGLAVKTLRGESSLAQRGVSRVFLVQGLGLSPEEAVAAVRGPTPMSIRRSAPYYALAQRAELELGDHATDRTSLATRLQRLFMAARTAASSPRPIADILAVFAVHARLEAAITTGILEPDLAAAFGEQPPTTMEDVFVLPYETLMDLSTQEPVHVRPADPIEAAVGFFRGSPWQRPFDPTELHARAPLTIKKLDKHLRALEAVAGVSGPERGLYQAALKAVMAALEARPVSEGRAIVSMLSGGARRFLVGHLRVHEAAGRSGGWADLVLQRTERLFAPSKPKLKDEQVTELVQDLLSLRAAAARPHSLEERARVKARKLVADRLAELALNRAQDAYEMVDAMGSNAATGEVVREAAIELRRRGCAAEAHGLLMRVLQAPRLHEDCVLGILSDHGKVDRLLLRTVVAHVSGAALGRMHAALVALGGRDDAVGEDQVIRSRRAAMETSAALANDGAAVEAASVWGIESENGAGLGRLAMQVVLSLDRRETQRDLLVAIAESEAIQNMGPAFVSGMLVTEEGYVDEEILSAVVAPALAEHPAAHRFYVQTLGGDLSCTTDGGVLF